MSRINNDKRIEKGNSMVKQAVHLEIEVKFHIGNVESLMMAMQKMGGVSQGRVFEQNIRFDTPSAELLRKGCLLRLRQDTATHLTFKSPPPQESEQYKVFRELETTVSDHAVMKAILVALGFQPVQIYEKWRETFAWQNFLLCLDTLPFGTFLEIEGQGHGLPAVAEALGLDWERRILTNYLAMFDQVKKRLGLGFNDLTFANFKNFSAEALKPAIDIF
jgi:adenylate cyclase class 2